jgi:hypothetical protein
MSDSNGSHPSDPSAPAQLLPPSHIRLLPIDPAAIPALASLGYQSFYDFSISVAQPPEFQSVQAYHDTLLAELDKEETFHLMAVREEGVDKSSPYHVEGVGEVLGSVLMDCSAEVAAIGPISVSSSRQKVGVGRHVSGSETHRRLTTLISPSNTDLLYLLAVCTVDSRVLGRG